MYPYQNSYGGQNPYGNQNPYAFPLNQFHQMLNNTQSAGYPNMSYYNPNVIGADPYGQPFQQLPTQPYRWPWRPRNFLNAKDVLGPKPQNPIRSFGGNRYRRIYGQGKRPSRVSQWQHKM